LFRCRVGQYTYHLNEAPDATQFNKIVPCLNCSCSTKHHNYLYSCWEQSIFRANSIQSFAICNQIRHIFFSSSKTYPLPPSTQFCPHVPMAYILVHKCILIVHESGIVKWIIMDMFTSHQKSLLAFQKWNRMSLTYRISTQIGEK